MKYKNAAIVCAAAGCLFILLAVVCGGAVRWCAMAAALVCLGYLAVQYAHCAADMDALRRQSGEKMLHPLGRELADALEKREISQREAYTAAVSSSQSKINALQNQINPHFLYNTLEGIRGEAITAGLDNVAQMTEALATFFRYTISNLENLVTLEDELGNIENYFIIQQYRFGERLRLQVVCDEDDRAELMQCRIPKLTLQPIVENSIVHGVERKIGRGNLRIKIEGTAKRLIITVSDDGLGMEEDVLAALNRQISSTRFDYVCSDAKREGGIALVNVNNRIKLLFGEQYGLCIYSTPGVGTDVEVTLPRATRGAQVTG